MCFTEQKVRVQIRTRFARSLIMYASYFHFALVHLCKDCKKAQPSKQEIMPREPAPPRQETITSKGGEINLKDEIGATLSVPRNSTAKDEQLNLAVRFSGSYEMPEGVESVSPAYLIKTTNEVEFHEPVDLTLQHTSYLQTAEDCKEMVILKASITSTAHEDSDSRLKFENIDNDIAAVKFSPGERHGELKLKKLSSWLKIGRKQKSRDEMVNCCMLYSCNVQRKGFIQQGCIRQSLA